MEDIQIIAKFSNVIPKYFHKIPPKKEIRFAIEVVLGIAPISKTPSRMTPIVLNELKEQLQESIDKKFICPNHSP